MKSLKLILFIVSLLTFLVSCNEPENSASNSNGKDVVNSNNKVLKEKYFVYVTNFDDDTLSVKKLNNKLGVLEDVETHYTCSNPNIVKPHHNRKWLYISCSGQDTVGVYSIDQETGELTGKSQVGGDGLYPHGLSISPDGNHLIVSYESSAKLVSYEIANDGSLTYVDEINSAVADGSYGAPHDVWAYQGFVYVANYSASAHSIGVFELDENGMFTLVEYQAANGLNPKMLWPAGDFLISVNRGSDNISIFSRDSETGELEFIRNESVGDSPTSITYMQHDGGYAIYVANSADDTVSSFTYDIFTGDTTPISVDSVGDKPVHIIGISAIGKLISLNGNEGNLTAHNKESNGSISNTGEDSYVGNNPTAFTQIAISK